VKVLVEGLRPWEAIAATRAIRESPRVQAVSQAKKAVDLTNSKAEATNTTVAPEGKVDRKNSPHQWRSGQ